MVVGRSARRTYGIVSWPLFSFSFRLRSAAGRLSGGQIAYPSTQPVTPIVSNASKRVFGGLARYIRFPVVPR